MGSVWSRLGSNVTVVEALDRIVPTMDGEIAKEFMKMLTKQGLEFKLSHKVSSAKSSKSGVDVEMETSDKKKIKDGFEFPTRLNQFEEFLYKENKSDFLTSTRKTTWRSSYKPYMKRILNIYNDFENEALEKIFQKTLESYNEGTRSRKQCATSLSVLAKFLDIKLPEDWKLNSRGYGLNKAGFRDLPKDELIEKLWETIQNNSWKLDFGLMATYGLRNHEVFFCDLSSLTNFGD